MNGTIRSRDEVLRTLVDMWPVKDGGAIFTRLFCNTLRARNVPFDRLCRIANNEEPLVTLIHELGI